MHPLNHRLRPIARSGSSSPTSKPGQSPAQSLAPAPPAVELLIEVVQQLSLARSLAQVTELVGAAARRLTGADGASFVLRDGDQCFYADEDAISPLWKGQRFPMDICVSGWVMTHRVAVAIPDIRLDPRVPIEAYRPTFVRSMAMVPIRTHAPLGAIGNYWAQPHTPSTEELRILQALADSTAVAMESIRTHEELEERVRERTEQLEAANRELRAEALRRKQVEAKVRQLSLTDDLTGLSNRRGFLLRAEQMLKLIPRVHTHAWLVYIDLDGLKLVNDNLGHEAGDRLIRSAAKVLTESFRDSDILGRIGGDEFVVLATGATSPSIGIEDRLKQNIEHHNRFYPDQPALAMSVGIIRCNPSTMHPLEEMIHQADAAMYIEKRRKRQRLADGAPE